MKLIHSTQTIDTHTFAPVIQMTVEVDLEAVLGSHAFMDRDVSIRIFGERFFQLLGGTTAALSFY